MTPEDVYRTIDQLADFILRYAVTLAAIGALSMALIELLKTLFSWRDRFHKKRFCDWVRNVPIPQAASEEICRSLPANDAAFHQNVYIKLIQLTTGEPVGPSDMAKPIEWMPWVITPGNALFVLDLEKMMGQIQDAADTVLGHPRVYPDLYLFFSAGADPNDIAQWFRWAQHPPAQTTTHANLAKDQADTYARLRQFIRRRLDAFQLTAGYQWQTGNQVASVLLGAVLLFGSLIYLAPPNLLSRPLGWVGLIVTSLIGGIMAPVAKDLVIALKRMRSSG